MSRTLSTEQRRVLMQLVRDRFMGDWSSCEASLRALARHGYAKREPFVDVNGHTLGGGFVPTPEGRQENVRLHAAEIAQCDREYRLLGIPLVDWLGKNAGP